MAEFSQGAQTGGLYSQIQELVAQHVSGLEFVKIEENKLALQQAEETRQAIVKLEFELKKAEEAVKREESKKDLISLEISNLENQKLQKVSEFELIDSAVKYKKEEKVSIESQKDASKEILDQIQAELALIKSKKDLTQKEANELVNLFQEKQNALKFLNEKNEKALKDSIELENKIRSSKELIEKLSKDHESVLAEIELAKNLFNEAESKKVSSQEELKKALIEIELKKKSEEEKLISISNEVKANEAMFALSKQEIENEMSFIKQMNESNAQKSKNFAYAKDKLQEIITKIIPELDEARALDFKNLLFVVKKL